MKKRSRHALPLLYVNQKPRFVTVARHCQLIKCSSQKSALSTTYHLYLVYSSTTQRLQTKSVVTSRSILRCLSSPTDVLNKQPCQKSAITVHAAPVTAEGQSRRQVQYARVDSTTVAMTTVDVTEAASTQHEPSAIRVVVRDF